MTSDEWVDGWIKGFVEAQGSFAMNIGVGKSKNSSWIVFKPYISLANVDKKQMEFIREYFHFDVDIMPKKRKKMYENPVYSLNIQRQYDIELFLEKFKNHQFRSSFKQEAYDKFCVCYEKVKEYGFTHHSLTEQVEKLIELKLDINKKRGNINKVRFSKKVWTKKIQDHFGQYMN